MFSFSVFGVDFEKKHESSKARIAHLKIQGQKAELQELFSKNENEELALPQKSFVIGKAPSSQLLVRSFLLPSRNPLEIKKILELQVQKLRHSSNKLCVEKQYVEKRGSQFLWQVQICPQKALQEEIKELQKRGLDPEVLSSAPLAALLFCNWRHQQKKPFAVLCFEASCCFCLSVMAGKMQNVCSLPWGHLSYKSSHQPEILAALKTLTKGLEQDFEEVLLLGEPPKNFSLEPHYETLDPDFQNSSEKERHYAIAIGLALSKDSAINFRKNALTSAKTLKKLQKNLKTIAALGLLSLLLLFLSSQNILQKKQKALWSKTEHLQKSLNIAAKKNSRKEIILSIQNKIKELEKSEDLRNPELSLLETLNLLESAFKELDTQPTLHSIQYQTNEKASANRDIKIDLSFEELPAKSFEQLEIALKKNPSLKKNSLSWSQKNGRPFCSFFIQGAL